MPAQIVNVPVQSIKKMQEFECDACAITARREFHQYHETDAPPGWWKVEGRRDTRTTATTGRWFSLYFCGTNCLQAYAGWPE